MTNHNMIPNSNPNIHAFYNDGTTRPVVAWLTGPPMALVMDEYGLLGGAGSPSGFSHVGVKDPVADRLESIDKHLDNILRHAFGDNERVGDFDHPVTRRVEVGDENEELRTFAVAVEAAWGSSPWVGAEVIAETLEPNPRITVDDLPETAAQKIHLPGPGARVSLGKWLARHEDAPVGSLRIRKGEPRPGTGSKGGKEWWIEKEDRP